MLPAKKMRERERERTLEQNTEPRKKLFTVN